MRSNTPSSGFSLTELLVVICLISILAAFSIPAMSGIGFSGNTRTAAVELSSVFNEARMLAVSQNTYTYVFFKEGTAPQSMEALLVCSNTGVNVFESADTLDLGANGSGRPIRRVKLEQVGLLPDGDLPAPTAVPYERPPATAHLGEGYKLVDRGATYEKSIVFRPSGEIAIPQSTGVLSYAGLTELALSWNTAIPGRPSLAPRPVLIFQIAGATGQTTIHRAH